MARRFALRLLAAASARDLEGARISHRRTGPRLVGTYHGRKLSIPLPRCAGEALPDGVAIRRIANVLDRAKQRRDSQD